MVRAATEEALLPATLGESESSQNLSDCSVSGDDDVEPSEADEDDMSLGATSCVRTNLCAILKGAVQPVASGRSKQLFDVSPTLQQREEKDGLLLSPLDFEEEERMGAQAALQMGDPGNDEITTILPSRIPKSTPISITFPPNF